jgi:hypothetical protein
MNDKPDAQQYATVVLWHLCTIQASLQLLQADTIRQSGEQAGADAVDILRETSKHGKQLRKHAESLYQDALQQANIKPSPTFPYHESV